MPAYKRRSLAALGLGLSCLLSFSSSYAWNALGHSVIANIAYAELTPDAKEKVDHLVAYFHEEYPDIHTFQQMVDWPDQVRAQRITTYAHWHYVDNAFSDDGSSLKDVKDTDNAVWAINSIKDVVKNNRANPYEHARFLAFLAHIVSDLHQPLHAVTRFSSAHPDGDKGGNLYTVRFHNEHSNLHAMWDAGVGVFSGENTKEHMDDVTNKIMAKYPQRYFGDKVSEQDPDAWATAGMGLAKKYVYNTPLNQVPDDGYMATGKQVSEEQAALAGYRLAYMLNHLLAE